MTNSKESTSDKQTQQLPEQDVQQVALVPPPPAPQPKQPLDEVPWEGGGGRFLVNGRLVDHEGRPITKDGKLKKDED